MRLNPYLTFDGRCREAFEFYQANLGAKILMMQAWGDTPMAGEAPPGMGDRIIHARATIGDDILMGSDGMAGNPEKPQGFSVSLGVEDPAEAERAFAALSQGGEVRMPIAETFWALRFGILTDKFGIPWMVNCERPA